MIESWEVQAPGLTATFENVSWGSVLVAQGELAGSALGQLLGEVQRRSERHNHLAGLCDYRNARLSLDPRRLLMCARAVAPTGLEWPTALVVPVQDLTLWREYAHMQGMRGKLRGVFTDYEAARAWSVEHAGLRLAQFRSRGFSQ